MNKKILKDFLIHGESQDHDLIGSQSDLRLGFGPRLTGLRNQVKNDLDQIRSGD